MKIYPSVFFVTLLQIAACGSSAVAPVDSAGDLTSEAADSDAADDQSVDQAPTCPEFLACPRANLIYGPDGCPTGCNVNGPPSDVSSGIDFALDQHFSTAAQASNVGCDADATGCPSD